MGCILCYVCTVHLLTLYNEVYKKKLDCVRLNNFVASNNMHNISASTKNGYAMIYILLTAIGCTACGSSTVHSDTQTVLCCPYLVIEQR
jgi:hypothetical protein